MTVREMLGSAGVKSGLDAAIAEARVDGLEYDSRRSGPGSLFFAFAGARADGRDFAAQAIENGAIAVVSELARPSGFTAPWIEVEHGRKALALAARRYYREPDTRLKLTGITGTNGKTTTAFLLDAILRSAGFTTGLMGTIEYRMGDQVLPAVNTTPESLDVMRFFAGLEQIGGTHVTMEVSSHALALRRIFAIAYHTAVFTNLTRDHLDFHGTMQDYFEAKQLLFHPEDAPAPPFSVLNRDDEWARRIRAAGETIWYGIGHDADLRAENVESGLDGLRFTLVHAGQRQAVRSALAGRINVYNILAASGAAVSLGVGLPAIATGVEACRAVPGRFERVDSGQPFAVVVDYAHTDDALRNVIAAARGISKGQVITLFGCGGDRDRAKRPLMGMAAAEFSDFVVLTSDNPRGEDPLDIMNDALVGLRRFDTPHLVEPDRERAIRLAIERAQPGDIVILAGKGHETYQVLKDRTIHFDDREAARAVLESLGYR
ncbi:MAG: UDP-N-acetylmuramoyl-L-alanyl-D-glutamate--2,6-diaminopimelate ligase [Bryobacteraceae bacterium]|nr:UDP-N-acetylmuramoyl-L-alanyl-D-glutamate--2,6-diaminopimelate ligase [Bryobacteraceae bacterium]